jgi:hypothetical protein
MLLHHRNEFDVTGKVNTTDPDHVAEAICQLYGNLYQRDPGPTLLAAFADAAKFYRGEYPGYRACDTDYHDIKHVLDVTLAMARLMDGCKRATNDVRLDETMFRLGVIAALYHDVGYIRRVRDTRHKHGAEYTATHVGRGVKFLESYLPRIGMHEDARSAARMLHYTGYEVPVRDIRVAPRYQLVGSLLGSADIVAQMADRCYLEKCRDRLYAEFVLGGVALPIAANGGLQVKYASGVDLLRQTPEFITEVRAKRLEGEFHSAYRYLEILFEGCNPYMESIDRNVNYLRQILRSENWVLLRRNPPIFSAVDDPMSTTRTLLLGYITKAWAGV